MGASPRPTPLAVMGEGAEAPPMSDPASLGQPPARADALTSSSFCRRCNPRGFWRVWGALADGPRGRRVGRVLLVPCCRPLHRAGTAAVLGAELLSQAEAVGAQGSTRNARKMFPAGEAGATSQPPCAHHRRGAHTEHCYALQTIMAGPRPPSPRQRRARGARGQLHEQCAFRFSSTSRAKRASLTAP